jgi:DNA-binding MarR family transcriptional regulator
MTADPRDSGKHYWYDGVPPRAIDVLNAVRAYRTADDAMRRRTRESMKMGENDLRTLRFLLKAQKEGRMVTSREVSDHLGMTSASVTAMLDRLTRSGHVVRRPHPTDRRSITIIATPGSDDEVRHTLGAMHARMMDVARGLSEREAATVVGFLGEMTTAVEAIDAPAPQPLEFDVEQADGSH